MCAQKIVLGEKVQPLFPSQREIIFYPLWKSGKLTEHCKCLLYANHFDFCFSQKYSYQINLVKIKQMASTWFLFFLKKHHKLEAKMHGNWLLIFLKNILVGLFNLIVSVAY